LIVKLKKALDYFNIKNIMEEKLNKKLKEKYSIGEFAKYFDVSNQAMQVRLGISV
jgi:hypothetical protein